MSKQTSIPIRRPLIRFKDYSGMPKGHEHDPLYSLSTRNIVNLSREKGDHYYILTRHNEFFFFFFPLILLFILYENFKKKCPERRVLILSEYIGMCSCPLSIPKILLKCNLFNMGAVKRSINWQAHSYLMSQHFISLVLRSTFQCTVIKHVVVMVNNFLNS